MVTRRLKVARIGNSRGVRLPAASLRRYHIGESVEMEELTEGILLRPSGPVVEKLSWDQTASEMAARTEDWGPWDDALADGLESIPWEDDAKTRVAERATTSRKKPSSRKSR